MILLLLVPAVSADYSGTLTQSGGGIIASGASWTSGDLTIDWTVSVTGNTSSFHYTLTVPQQDVSHFIIQVSDNFTYDDILSWSGPEGTSLELGWWDSSDESNPNLPGSFYGLKFDEVSGTTVDLYLETNRNPVWGDFYAKDGLDNAAWNEGFLTDDPLAPPADGSLLNHLLVPDGIIPEPGTLALLLPGLGLFYWVRRRRS